MKNVYKEIVVVALHSFQTDFGELINKNNTQSYLSCRYNNKDFSGELLHQCYDYLKTRQIQQEQKPTPLSTVSSNTREPVSLLLKTFKNIQKINLECLQLAIVISERLLTYFFALLFGLCTIYLYQYYLGTATKTIRNCRRTKVVYFFHI